jgi:dimethylaniline monooxygenase (N-oxide forming)
MRKTVAIIGAGAAGLCAAKHMLEADYDVTVYEIGSKVGGMWVYQNDNNRSSAYKTLHINTARDLTAFKDFAFDPKVQPFPDHKDMAKYLKAYADHFGITQRIKFRTPVKDIRPAANYAETHPRWTVETAGETTGGTADYDSVIVATGHLTKPFEVEQFKTFGGHYLHSCDYKDPAIFASKRICVVGVGNSSCDIASDICTMAERTVLVGRSSPLIIPKLIFGRPFWETVKPFYKPWVPAAVRTRAVKFFTWIVHGKMADLGFAPSTKKVHATSNANIVNHIRYHRVAVKQGITAVEGKTITFTDGSKEEFDTLIAATGFVLDLEFVKPEIVAIKDNSLDLYMRIVPPDWRGLYFLGFFNSDSALNWIVEGQIRWLREFELGRAQLPTKPEMLTEVATRRAAVHAAFKDSPRHGIEVEHMPYFADMRRSLKQAQAKAGRHPRDVGIGTEKPTATPLRHDAQPVAAE